jgi:hypothetical protein
LTIKKSSIVALQDGTGLDGVSVIELPVAGWISLGKVLGGLVFVRPTSGEGGISIRWSPALRIADEMRRGSSGMTNTDWHVSFRSIADEALRGTSRSMWSRTKEK